MTRFKGTAIVLGAVAVGVAWAIWPFPSLPDGARADRVVVWKAARTLTLYRGTEAVRSYTVSLGHSPVGPKRREGDGRTPEGDYILDYRLPDSDFHRALHVSYPSPADTRRRDRAETPGIYHASRNEGTARVHRPAHPLRWTDGCIAVTDAEIDEISRVLATGAPIRIEP
jgi:murein L,D-transpeptidase YafK